MEIRKMLDKDWPRVADIYRQGMETGIATFETRVPSYQAWDQNHLPFCRYVAWLDGRVVGWAALSPVSRRAVYSGVAELSVYVSGEAQKKGVGRHLMDHLISESEKCGIWTLQSGVFPDNLPSIRLHVRSGFRKLGIREKIAKRNGRWQDNILFERRSRIVGHDSAEHLAGYPSMEKA